MKPSLGRPPLALVAAGGLALLLLLVPLVALVARAPWDRLGTLLGEGSLGSAIRLSVVTASLAALICVLLGVPLAWLLARREFRGRKFVRAAVTVPLVMPPVVAGVALLSAFGRRGVVGGPLYDQFGITIPFSTVAVVLAQAFVALPFIVLAVENAFRAIDPVLGEYAATAGAGPWQVFRRIDLPLALPGILTGAVLAWARAIGEFGATITFAGNAEGVTRTMPLEIYTALQADPDAAIALSLVLLALSIGVLLLLRERWLSRTWD